MASKRKPKPRNPAKPCRACGARSGMPCRPVCSLLERPIAITMHKAGFDPETLRRVARELLDVPRAALDAKNWRAMAEALEQHNADLALRYEREARAARRAKL